MSSSGSDNDENDCFSMMGTSEVSKQILQILAKKKSMSGSVYKAWSFQLTIKADFGSCTAGTAGEQGKLLTEHLKTRTGHGLPSSVTSMAVFFDELLCSVPPDDAGLVSIALQGYVQARYAIPLSTLKGNIQGLGALCGRNCKEWKHCRIWTLWKNKGKARTLKRC